MYRLLLASLLGLSACTYEVQHSLEGEPLEVLVIADVDLKVAHELTADVSADIAHAVSGKSIEIILLSR